MADRFFSFDPDDGFHLHPDADDARANADRILDEYRDMAGDDGWPDDVESVYWGEVREHVVETDRKAIEQYEAEGDEYMAEVLREAGHEATVDYGLVSIETGEPVERRPTEAEHALGEIARIVGARGRRTPSEVVTEAMGLRAALRTAVELLHASRDPGHDWNDLDVHTLRERRNEVLRRLEVSRG